MRCVALDHGFSGPDTGLYFYTESCVFSLLAEMKFLFIIVLSPDNKLVMSSTLYVLHHLSAQSQDQDYLSTPHSYSLFLFKSLQFVNNLL